MVQSCVRGDKTNLIRYAQLDEEEGNVWEHDQEEERPIGLLQSVCDPDLIRIVRCVR
jgi:hypothetical protein